MKTIFENSSKLMVKQVKEVFEIVTNWETANKYALYDENNNKVGFAAEKSYGVFHKIVRNIMRSHRTITVDIWNKSNIHTLTGHRPWYFFFSNLNVLDSQGKAFGYIKTRFGVLKRKYDITDGRGHIFATIESYRWRLWTFTIFDSKGKEIGVITKKWGGVLKEIFTDADRFMIDYSKYQWSEEQKAILLFACLSIDLDFFEDNSRSVLDMFNR